MKSLLSLFLLFPVLAQEELPSNPVIEKLKTISVTVEYKDECGSGIVVQKDDYCFILTAAHVVENARTVKKVKDKEEVSFNDCKVLLKTIEDGRIVGELSFDAEVVKYDREEDLAVLLVRKKKAFTSGISFYLGEKLPPVGTKLYHVGSPLGELGSQSVIPGFYSAHGRIVETRLFDTISCNAFPGSSGGAVVLEDGRYIGMVLRGRPGGFVLIKPIRVITTWLEKNKMKFLVDPKEKLPGLDEIRKLSVIK